MLFEESENGLMNHEGWSLFIKKNENESQKAGFDDYNESAAQQTVVYGAVRIKTRKMFLPIRSSYIYFDLILHSLKL